MTIESDASKVSDGGSGVQNEILKSALTKLEQFESLSHSQRKSLLALIVQSADRYQLESAYFCCHGGLDLLLGVATQYHEYFADVCHAFFGLAESGTDSANICSTFLLEKQALFPTELFKQEENIKPFLQMHLKVAHKLSSVKEIMADDFQPIKTCLYGCMFVLEHASADHKSVCVKHMIGFPLKEFWILLMSNALCIKACTKALLSGGHGYRQTLLHFMGKLKEHADFAELKAFLLQSILDRSASFFRNLKKEESAMLLEALFISFPQEGAWLITNTCAYEQVQLLLNCKDDMTVKLMMGILPHLASSKEGKERFNEQEIQDLLSRAGNIMDDDQIKSNSLLTLAKIAKSEHNHDEDKAFAMGALSMLTSMAGENFENDTSLEVATRLVETLVFLVENNIVKDMVADRIVESKFDLLSKLTDKNVSLCFGLSHIFYHVTATKSELDMVPLLTEEIDDDARQRQIASQMMKNKADDSFVDTDTPKQCKKRKETFCKANGIASLVCLVKNGSTMTKTNIAETMFHLSAESSIRASMVQQGAITLLLKLVKEDDTKCKVMASHALARILISVNPALLNDIHILECVVPLLNLIKRDYALPQFEGLLALTNLATVGMELQDLIVGKGYSTIEELQWSNHKMVVRAATELLCNCVSCEKVLVSMQDQAKQKIWIALAFSEDTPTALASCGALAMASNDPDTSSSLILNGTFGDFVDLAGSREAGLQHRACVALENLTLNKNAWKSLAKGEPLSKLKSVSNRIISDLAQASFTAAVHNLTQL